MAYGTVSELARRLRIVSPPPTAAQTEALQLCLDAAAEEIDWFLNGTPDWTPPPTDPADYPALVVETNYERAAQHWSQGQITQGPALDGNFLPIVEPRLNNYLIRTKLRPLKGSGATADDAEIKVFGIA